MGGGFGGMLGSLPATPELLARVAALPPATDAAPPDLPDDLIEPIPGRKTAGSTVPGRRRPTAVDSRTTAPISAGRAVGSRCAAPCGPVRGLLILSLVLIALDALASLALPVLIRHGIDDGVSKGVIGVVWLARPSRWRSWPPTTWSSGGR